MNKSFLPIILGTDINAYTMSVSFHQQYNIKPVLIGQIPMWFTKGSTIIQDIHYVDNLEQSDVFLSTLNDIKNKYGDKYEHLILIGTNDLYVKLIISHRDLLKDDFLFNYIDDHLFERLYYKKHFYDTCEELGLDIPTTYFHSCKADESFNKDISFPVIVKPNNGVEYYANPFEGMKKVYKVDNKTELNNVIKMITDSGYSDELIIQDFIPGDDTYMWDAVYYGNQEGKGEFISFAQVALQEHTSTGIGNYTALIVRENKVVMKKLVEFMEKIQFKGFANFDMKYDERDGKFKVFEVNVRQGRSSYYMTQCGHNMAKYFVDDLIHNKNKELTYLSCEQVFSVVPKGVLKKYVSNKNLKEEIIQLIKNKKYGNPLFYKKDKGIIRWIMMVLRQINYYRKYKHSDWKV